MHCATDSFGHHPPRNKGAEDPLHPDDRRRVHHPRRRSKWSRIDIADPHFPGIDKGFGESGQFKINDEWYALKNMPEDLHVILVQVTKGMKWRHNEYERPNFPDDLGEVVRQGTGLLHLDGSSRRRLGKPQLPGPPPGCPGLGHRSG